MALTQDTSLLSSKSSTQSLIIPGLIFGVQIWQLYFFSLLTSAMLIWASYKKLLPTLVGFNTLWIWLSMMVLAQHLIE